MSRDTNQICRACGVFQTDTGVGFTLLDYDKRVEDFDATLFRRFQMTPDQLPPGNVNLKIRSFLERHQDHGDGVTHWSWDWVYDEDDPLEGLTLEVVPGSVRE